MSGLWERRFGRILALLLACGALQQAWILAEHWQQNPFARAPIDDARVYWDWAERIASGRLIGDTPFLSAPLYPYLLGVVRALGGGLLSVFALQGCMRLATAALLALSGRRLVSAGTGLAAAALYLLFTDPAEATGRVLNESLQALLAATLLAQSVAVARRHRGRAAALLGLLLGLNALANPPMLAAIPLLVLWLWATAPAGQPRWKAPLLAGSLALLVLAPSLLHNRLASGEWILVSAQGGVTFAHGNAPDADGTYHPIPGVSADRSRQNRDAFDLAAAAGGEAGWRGASSYFFRRGLDYWRSDPMGALALTARKGWWFLTGRHYGDIYIASLEREEGFLDRLALAPVPVAWCTLPALLMAVLLARSVRRSLPLLLLFTLPLLVVLAFWYSPRYRMPAVPAIALLAAWSLQELAQREPRTRRGVLLAGGWLLGIGASALNGAIDFDRAEAYRPQFEQKTGTVYLEQERYGDAEARFRRALERQPGDPSFTASLGESLRRQGRGAEALPALREAVSRHPEEVSLRRTLAVTLAGEAVTSNDRAMAEEAEVEFRAVLEQDARDVLAWDNLGLLLDWLGRSDEAAYAFLEVLGQAPDNEAARRHLLDVRERLLAFYREHAAADPLAAAAGAWLLAHLPDASSGELEEALQWAQAADRSAGSSDPDFLDTLAAVHARRGEFAEAVTVTTAALEAARAAGRADLAREIEGRRARYQSGRSDLIGD